MLRQRQALRESALVLLYSGRPLHSRSGQIYKEHFIFKNFMLHIRVGCIKSCKVEHKLNSICLNLIYCRVDVFDASIIEHIPIIRSQVSDFLVYLVIQADQK